MLLWFLGLLLVPAQSCGTASFPVSRANVQCLGLTQVTSAASSGDCAVACCSQYECQIWQWCDPGAGCKAVAGCWVGTLGQCQNETGWLGGSRPAFTQGALDKAFMDKTFDGIGGLSGGGATTRLLVDYPDKQRNEVLDFLFLPNFGASLQILKVEIGGDSQSTDGTESSHMHSKDDLDLGRGYEWWLMTEAKKRNPNIKLYGLPWAYPGWVGNDPVTGKPSGSPFTYPNQTSEYIMQWTKGAKSRYSLDIDYIGIWNERASDAKYAEQLRQTLDDAGFQNTKIVAKDGGSDICTSMAEDPTYAKTVDIIGLHYPSDYSDYSECHGFNKPVWASEESSSYDDLNGAACWARVVNSHFVLSGMTASIMWNLVGSYYHGTNWYASSMLTAVQPWSGHYDMLEVVWSTAHVTQFTKIGWKYLENGHGSGQLPQGGFYTTIVDPNGPDFTLLVVKISYDHAACTRPHLPSFEVHSENVTFSLNSSMGSVKSLAVWRSNFEQDPAILFEKQPDMVVTNGKFTLPVVVGDYYTISTVRTAQKGAVSSVPESQPSFPLPYSDDFKGYKESTEARYFADQIGAFEIHPSVADPSLWVLRQMVPQLPIGWSDHGSNGPMTLIGMREWQDVHVSVSFYLPPIPSSAACIGTRVDQMWENGIVLCVSGFGDWNLTIGGPPITGVWTKSPLYKGKLEHPLDLKSWHTLSLSTVDSQANATVDGIELLKDSSIRNIDVGFACVGMNDWLSVEFGNFSVVQAGSHWTPYSCPLAKPGSVVAVRECEPNGLAAVDQSFELRSDWQLRHIATGLCVTATAASAGAKLIVDNCQQNNTLQQFQNDYTNVRNNVVPFTLVAQANLLLAGNTKKQATLESVPTPDTWTKWSAFPNTNQLRNQYISNPALGYPLCLSVCG